MHRGYRTTNRMLCFVPFTPETYSLPNRKPVPRPPFHPLFPSSTPPLPVIFPVAYPHRSDRSPLYNLGHRVRSLAGLPLHRESYLTTGMPPPCWAWPHHVPFHRPKLPRSSSPHRLHVPRSQREPCTGELAAHVHGARGALRGSKVAWRPVPSGHGGGLRAIAAGFCF